MTDLQTEAEILLASQGFADAQAAIRGVATPYGQYATTWYGTTVRPERGSFAAVREGGDHEALVGSFVQFWHEGRAVRAYVIGFGEFPETYEFAITRRLFIDLEFLAVEGISADVEVLR